MIEPGATVAVTGASGFIGSALLAEFTSRGNRVRALSRRTGSASNGVHWVRGDLGDPGAIDELVRGASLIVHAASYVHRRPRTDAEIREVRRTNVDGTRRVADAAAKQPGSVLLFVSSTSVYGASRPPWNESTPCRPLTVYGASKLEAEHVVLEAHPRSAVIRPSAVVGKGAPGSLLALDSFIVCGIVPLVDEGRARKSLTHVSTVVSAVLTLADQMANDEIPTGRRVFVVSDDEPYSVRDVASWRAKSMRLTPRFVSVPRPALGPIARLLDRGSSLCRLSLPSAAALVGTLADEAVVDSRRMRDELGVVPNPTARAYLNGALEAD